MFLNKYTLLLILFYSVALVFSFNLEKVKAHFQDYDLNKDGLLQRKEYILTLKEEDVDYEISDEDQYYEAITQLLYEQYDKDEDKALSLQEWLIFSQDIIDQQSEEYKQILLDPKLQSGQL